MNLFTVIVLNLLLNLCKPTVCVAQLADTEEAKQHSHSCSMIYCSKENGNIECPPGMFCENGSCVCGAVYPNRLISCNGISSSVLRFNCVTFDSTRNLTVVGSCIHSLKSVHFARYYAGDDLYHQLPSSVYELDDFMCGPQNRTGLQCGSCQPGLYPLAYSYSLACVPCSDNDSWNWLKYVLAAYLPLTFFYVIMLFFKVNITSSHLFAVVYYCQTLTSPGIIRDINSQAQVDAPLSLQVLINVFFSLYGIWNLDFFRPFYSHLCLKADPLFVLSLDYIVAVYPFLLMLITYLLIKLHDKNYKIVSMILSPFQKVLSLFTNNWEVKTSVVDVFATFFLLSNIKFLNVSFEFLVPIKVYYLHPNSYTHNLRLRYAADVEYFGREHLPYALLAISIMSVFIVLPITVFPHMLFILLWTHSKDAIKMGLNLALVTADGVYQDTLFIAYVWSC